MIVATPDPSRKPLPEPIGRNVEAEADLRDRLKFGRHMSITPGKAGWEKWLGTGGWKSSGEFHQAVARSPFSTFAAGALGLYRQRLNDLPIIAKDALGLNSSSPSEGFMVPPDFATEIVDAMSRRVDALWPRCRPRNTGGVVYHYQTPAETDRSTGRNGGLTHAWSAEAGTLAVKSAKFYPNTLRLKKLYIYAVATSEIVEDVPALESWLVNAVADEFNFAMNDGIVNGPGGSQFLGILNADCTITVAAESGQASGSIVGANIKKMYKRLMLGRGRRRETVWLASETAIDQVLALGSDFITYIPGEDYPRLMNMPIIECEACPSIGSKGDIILAHLPSYIAVQKTAGIKAVTSLHLHFLTDESAYRYTLRCAGQPAFHAPITPYDASATVSPFVVLDAR
jgi:HK97 family phage major capsid protein